jgi:hypothetical protein
MIINEIRHFHKDMYYLVFSPLWEPGEEKKNKVIKVKRDYQGGGRGKEKGEEVGR